VGTLTFYSSKTLLRKSINSGVKLLISCRFLVNYRGITLRPNLNAAVLRSSQQGTEAEICDFWKAIREYSLLAVTMEVVFLLKRRCDRDVARNLLVVPSTTASSS
jgi:hypothetical protein